MLRHLAGLPVLMKRQNVVCSKDSDWSIELCTIQDVDTMLSCKITVILSFLTTVFKRTLTMCNIDLGALALLISHFSFR